MKKKLLLTFLLFGVSLVAQIHNSDTTFVINKKKFNINKREINSSKVKLTIKRNSKTIMTETLDSDGLTNIEFPDFNNDGNKDIMLVYMGNNFTYYLYLFDKINNSFKKVEGFERFPESTQLTTNPNFYYSYQRAGCADLNWVSDLFYIKDFKTVHVGHIYGKGCDYEIKENPQIIEVYKISGNKETNRKLIENLPYIKNVPRFDEKWEFIKKYWNANYLKF